MPVVFIAKAASENPWYGRSRAGGAGGDHETPLIEKRGESGAFFRCVARIQSTKHVDELGLGVLRVVDLGVHVG
jgi:hypothetical protein